MISSSRSTLARFLILYAALYAGFGVQSPYLPTLLDNRHLRPETIALVLAAGTAVRLMAGPAAGRLADRLDAAKVILALCSAAAALIALGYLPAQGAWLLIAVGVLHSAALAPLAPLSDTLALGAAAPAGSDGAVGWRFHYGWLRGCGSAAFILGSVLSGQAIGHFGIVVIVWLNAALLAAAALMALGVPQLWVRHGQARATASQSRGVGALLRLPLYRKMVLLAALILGSHAMHDAFAMIRWSRAGINPGTSGFLWSLSVAAEVVVFVLIGRLLLDRIGSAGAAMLSAGAGGGAMGGHGRDRLAAGARGDRAVARLSFALLHLTCMRLLAQCVPRHLEATALTLYGTVGIGAATALLTLACGPIFARFGAHGFWAMAALCAVVLPLAQTLREPMAGSR
jgi:MFS transporter, PPP family, 3-phenylpropionic acid transporter